jgi:hypothetical protein
MTQDMTEKGNDNLTLARYLHPGLICGKIRVVSGTRAMTKFDGAELIWGSFTHSIIHLGFGRRWHQGKDKSLRVEA